MYRASTLIVEILIKRGANITGLDAYGNGVLPLALVYKHEPSVVELLLKEGAEISGLKLPEMQGALLAILDTSTDPDVVKIKKTKKTQNLIMGWLGW